MRPVGPLGAVEVRGRTVYGETGLDDVRDLPRADVDTLRPTAVVHELPRLDLVAAGVIVEAGILSPEGDEDDHLYLRRVSLRPGHDVGNERERLFVDCGVERARDPAHLGDEIRQPLSQLVQLDLGSAHPSRPLLQAVDVERDPGEAGRRELAEQRGGQRDTVRVDDRFQAALRDEPDHLGELRVRERVTARDRHRVGRAKALEHVEVGADLVERLVTALHVGGVTAVAADVALLGRLEP